MGVPLDHFGFSIFLGGLAIFGLLSYTIALKEMGWKPLAFKKLLAAMTLSGGSVTIEPSSYKYCVRYYGNDLVLHKIFCDLVNHAYGFKAKPARCKTNDSYITQIYRKKMVQDLLSFSPSYTTRNNDGKIDGNGPTAAFLLNSNRRLKTEAVRLASSATGCVRYTVEQKKENGDCYFVRPQFCFGYLSPPALLNDYRRILKTVEIETFPVFDRRFKMRGFLVSKSWRTIETYAKMNGFVDGVTINFGYHKGIARNRLLYALLSFHQHKENRFKTKEDAIENVRQYL